MKTRHFFILLFCLFFFACKKQPGEGGFATIEGRLFVRNYDASFTILNSSYYLPGENVYIIYGDGKEVGNSVKTSYDGTFTFSYLRKGKYKIFAVGNDSTKPLQSVPKEFVVEVEITKKKEKVNIGDLVILD